VHVGSALVLHRLCCRTALYWRAGRALIVTNRTCRWIINVASTNHRRVVLVIAIAVAIIAFAIMLVVVVFVVVIVVVVVVIVVVVVVIVIVVVVVVIITACGRCMLIRKKLVIGLAFVGAARYRRQQIRR
jgi:hypothetical protein